MFVSEFVDKATYLQNKVDQINEALDDIACKNVIAIEVLRTERLSALEALNALRRTEVTING